MSRGPLSEDEIDLMRQTLLIGVERELACNTNGPGEFSSTLASAEPTKRSTGRALTVKMSKGAGSAANEVTPSPFSSSKSKAEEPRSKKRGLSNAA